MTDFSEEFSDPSRFTGYTESEMRQMFGDMDEKLRHLGILAEAGKTQVGVAESEDGYIRVEYGTTGVSVLEINPRALRLPSEDLAASIKRTTNAAIQNLQTKFNEVVAELGIAANPDEYLENPELAREKIQDARERFTQSMGQASESMQRLLRSLEDPDTR
ncbi:hypothetical protein GCM10010191_44660 [Actinomadura vinacea]|uniref:YbaB/EbfC family DNA-binding protein n=1 Tax=Actinomadura vinacea TaxID=115336 RepID=A0ABN3JCP3_9ACTN